MRTSRLSIKNSLSLRSGARGAEHGHVSDPRCPRRVQGEAEPPVQVSRRSSEGEPAVQVHPHRVQGEAEPAVQDYARGASQLHLFRESEFFIDNLLVRVHFIKEMFLVDRPCIMGV